MAIIKEVFLPDIGNFKDVDIIEVLVAPGDRVQRETGLLILETDKATIEVPSPDEGIIVTLNVKTGDKVSKDSLLLTMEIETEGEFSPQSSVSQSIPLVSPPAAWGRGRLISSTEIITPHFIQLTVASSELSPEVLPAETLTAVENQSAANQIIHASPSVRRFARELGVALEQIRGSGTKGRITQDDVRAYVKNALTTPPANCDTDFFSGAKATPGIRLTDPPTLDFSIFGPVEIRPLSHIQRLAGANLLRNVLTIPHVTQFDEADITDLESFRQSQNGDTLEKNQIRLTLLPFVMKATVAALRHYPQFNASLDQSGEKLILKNYFHLSVAIDTQHGLVVPVIRDVYRKGLWELATELTTISAKARARKLTPNDLQGGCFSISSLGGIGGSHFTPIINAPEVAILGIGRAARKPVWSNNAFIPRLLLPLSLSYDHRVIDGVAGAQFINYLNRLLGDIRQLLL